jgi:hypothetical protein
MPPLNYLDNPTENQIAYLGRRWPRHYISAPITRLTRPWLEVIREDYVQRVPCLPERLVVYHHALRNMLIPLVTL